MNKTEATKKLTSYDFWASKPKLADVEDCIEAGADLTKLVAGDPLAFYAAKYLPDAVDVLAKKGVKIDQPGHDGMTALQKACYDDDVSPLGMKKLLDNKADVHVRMAEFNPDDGSYPDNDDEWKEWFDGLTLEEKRTFFPTYSNVSCVGFVLLKHDECLAILSGVPDDEKQKKQMEEHHQKLSLLFKAGIHPDAPAYDKVLPIFTTCYDPISQQTGQFILDNGGDIDAQNKDGDTALINLGNIIARDFKERAPMKKGKIRMNDAEKDEYLMKEYLGAVIFLISKGASLELANKKGKSFANGPASKVRFIDDIISVYYAGGKEAVVEYGQKWLRKILEDEKRGEWLEKYRETKQKEKQLRKKIATDLKEKLAKGTEKGRQEAMDIAEDFHTFKPGGKVKSSDDFLAKMHGWRPTALKFKKGSEEKG